LERRLVASRPRLQLVCRLASIDENEASAAGAVEARDRFWHDVRRRLGRLSRLSSRDIDEIEAAISWRVPRPSPLPQAAE
jgi:hypothetical protein